MTALRDLIKVSPFRKNHYKDSNTMLFDAPHVKRSKKDPTREEIEAATKEYFKSGKRVRKFGPRKDHESSQTLHPMLEQEIEDFKWG
tara:strand:- start:2585 stop:2845 length:261 start_codon:yes stop_codon:yes gene_type:complete